MTFHFSLGVFYLCLFVVSSPCPHPSASPADLCRYLLPLLRRSAGLSTSDFCSRCRKSIIIILFVIQCGISGFLSVATLCGGAVLFDVLTLGLRGLVLGIVFGVDYVYWKRWVLVFPTVQYSLFFSFIMGLPASFGQALKLSTLAYLISAVLMLFLPDLFKIESTIRQLLFQHVTIYLGTSIVSFCWELSHYLLQVLHTRRFIFAPPQGSNAAKTNPSEHLLAVLEQTTPGCIYQYLAYHDLYLVSDSDVDTWRRAAFFEETGETYRRVISACLRPLAQLTSRLAEGLEGCPAENSVLFSQQLSSPMVTHVDLRLQEAFNDSQLCAWSARTVASLTACSSREDRFRVAHLTGCNAAVVSTLLSCLLAIEPRMGNKANPQSLRLLSRSNIQWATVNYGRIDFAAMADALNASIYKIVSTFHDEMENNATGALLYKDWIIKSKPLYGTRENLVGRLSLFLAYFRAS